MGTRRAGTRKHSNKKELFVPAKQLPGEEKKGRKTLHTGETLESLLNSFHVRTIRDGGVCMYDVRIPLTQPEECATGIGISS